MLRLEILSGPLKGKRIELPVGIHTVGRGVGPLPFQDPELSGEHAKIHVLPNRIEIEDLKSRNGTFVNGDRVSKQVLSTGDQVRLGPEALFRVMGDAKEEAHLRTQASAPHPVIRQAPTPTPEAPPIHDRDVIEPREPKTALEKEQRVALWKVFALGIVTMAAVAAVFYFFVL